VSTVLDEGTAVTDTTATDTTGADTEAADAGAASDAAAASAAASPSWDDPALLDLVDTRAQGLVQQQLAPLIPLLEQVLGGGQGAAAAAQAAGQPQLVDEFGQVDPNALIQLLQQSQQQTLAQMQQMLQGIAAPLAQRQEQETVAEGEQRIKDMIADDVSRNGDLPAKAQAAIRPLADQLFPQIAERYGNTPRAAEMAVSQAAALVRDMVAEARTVALTTEQNRIGALAGVRGEPGVAGVAIEGLSDKPLSSRELALKYGAKATALTRT
jgi:hypothetical protein